MYILKTYLRKKEFSEVDFCFRYLSLFVIPIGTTFLQMRYHQDIYVSDGSSQMWFVKLSGRKTFECERFEIFLDSF